MRDLSVGLAEEGLRETFSDIETLALECRFRDCQHGSEPGCAVQSAIVAGDLDERQLSNYFKLQREDQRLTETIAQKDERTRAFSKQVRNHLKDTSIQGTDKFRGSERASDPNGSF